MKNRFKLTKEEQKIVDGLKTEGEKKRVIDSYRRQCELEHSLEGVHYQLGEIPLTSQMVSVVVNTVHKLPDTVKEFVYEKCQFTSPFDGGGCVYVKSENVTRHPWLIILAESLMASDESIVAHEIAHAFLDHKGGPGFGELEKTTKEETAACSLAKRWGFSGSGTKVNKALIEARKREIKRP